MSSLVRSELRKLTSTAATWWLALGVVALSLLAGATGSSNADAGEPLSHQQFVFVAAFTTKLVFVLLGIRIMTDELRHGTVIPTFLVSPRRSRKRRRPRRPRSGRAVRHREHHLAVP